MEELKQMTDWYIENFQEAIRFISLSLIAVAGIYTIIDIIRVEEKTSKDFVMVFGLTSLVVFSILILITMLVQG